MNDQKTLLFQGYQEKMHTNIVYQSVMDVNSKPLLPYSTMRQHELIIFNTQYKTPSLSSTNIVPPSSTPP